MINEMQNFILIAAILFYSVLRSSTTRNDENYLLNNTDIVRVTSSQISLSTSVKSNKNVLSSVRNFGVTANQPIMVHWNMTKVLKKEVFKIKNVAILSSSLKAPSLKPTTTKQPTIKPTTLGISSITSHQSTQRPTMKPKSSKPTSYLPSKIPTRKPTKLPTSRKPTNSISPTLQFPGPIEPTTRITGNPTKMFSRSPSKSLPPSKTPTTRPSTCKPSYPTTHKPTLHPTIDANFKSKSLIPIKPPTSSLTIQPTIIAYENDVHYHPYQPIMTGPIRLYNIYLGDFRSNQSIETMNLMDYFAAHIGGSSWYNSTTLYYQMSPNGVKTYASSSVTFVKRVNALPTSKGLYFNETKVINLIIQLINSNLLPLDTNGIYSVIMRGDFVFEGWLNTWCGYHTAFYLRDGRIIKFVVIGDPSTAPGNNGYPCEALEVGTANGNVGADSMVSIYAHEIVETVTDFMGAWYFDIGAINLITKDSLAGSENADACSWIFGDGISNSNIVIGTKPFLIQYSWIPGYGRLTL